MENNEKSKIDDLIEHVEEYFQTRQELGKLVMAEKSSAVLSSVVTSIVLLFVFLLVFIFASIALAYGISQYAGQAYAGFLAVAFLYFVIGIILYANREKWLKTPMANAVIKNFFKNQEHE